MDDKYGADYPPDSSCDWIITVPPAKIVRLSFDRFDLEWTSGCTADYVEVLDGSTIFSRSKGRFCGSTLPQDVLSTGRYMRVRFRSDSEHSYYLGFKATFTAEDKLSKWKFFFSKSNNRQCSSFSLFRNLITHSHVNYLPKLQKNDKKVAFRGRPTATALSLMARSIRVARPIRSQNLH